MRNMKNPEQRFMPATRSGYKIIIASGAILTIALAVVFANQLRGTRELAEERIETSIGPSSMSSAVYSGRIIRIVSPTFSAGQNSTVVVELDSLGNENAVGLSLVFNTNQLTFISAVKGSDAANATLNVNSSSAGNGRIGLVLAHSSDQTFASGTRQLMVVTFAAATSGSIAVSSSDQPVWREVVDASGNTLAATFSP